MTPVSAVIITYNEEKKIKRCLRKLWWCDEIIIVDSGSTDKTIEICESYNCKISHRKFDGYGVQKRFGVSLAKNDWILSLDADEILTNDLVDEIRLKLNVPAPGCEAYLLPMKLIFMGQQFHYGNENRKYFLRLFNKRFGNFTLSQVDERVDVNGRIEKMTNKVLHCSYNSLAEFLHKIDKCSTYGANEAFKKNNKKSNFTIVSALPFNFFKYYILRGNFLNGLNGFYWSAFNAYYHFVKYIKLNELYKNKSYGFSGELRRKETTSLLISNSR